MKCPICGAKTQFVFIDLNKYEEIIGCEDCIAPEVMHEDVTEVHEDYFDDEEDDEPWEPYARYEGEE